VAFVRPARNNGRYLEETTEGNVVHKHVGKFHLRFQTAVRSG